MRKSFAAVAGAALLFAAPSARVLVPGGFSADWNR